MVKSRSSPYALTNEEAVYFTLGGLPGDVVKSVK